MKFPLITTPKCLIELVFKLYYIKFVSINFNIEQNIYTNNKL